MIVQQALSAATARLAAAGIEQPARDARLLMAAVLDIGADRLTLHLRDAVTDARRARFEAAVARRAGREPMSHILGGRQFYGRWFKVSADVLDPRPETETLIAAALHQPFSRVLDLGTGSGCILLTLLSENPSATGLGVDLSGAALAIAETNARAFGLTGRVQFCRSDWFDSVTGRFDLIVSNPPYIARAELEDLAPELAHEPVLALSDGGDGLAAYRAILADFARFLTPGGRLLLEIGWRQGAALRALAQAAGLQDVEILPDLAGRDRVVSAVFQG